MQIRIEQAQPSCPQRLYALADALRIAKDSGSYERHFMLQEDGKRVVLVAVLDGRDVGYCILNWNPKYGFFRAQGIPEIQDLNVLRDVRRQGIATAMIRYCEDRAVAKGFKQMGIGVGLDRSFGPAQILYVKMGYVPDGNGISYDRMQLTPGEFRPLDEQLCLMMVKDVAGA